MADIRSHFYEAFVSGVPGVFNVRDRAEHTRKRKIIAHAFSPGAVHAFEPYMTANLSRWVGQLDKIAASRPDEEGGYARFNLMPWCTFLAFDIIGDLAFGAPFGMVERGRDECESDLPGQPVTLVPGAETLNRRGEVCTTMGLLPTIRPYAAYLPDPFFSKGLRSVKNLYGMAVAAVDKRLAVAEKEPAGGGRHDILEMLCRARDGDGNPMPRDELISESLTQLIAGSDTVSNTACAVIYLILDGERRSPGTVVPRLQAELDSAVPPGLSPVAAHSQVKNLPFLRRCIDEGMRLHSTSAIGLPRIVTAPRGVEYAEYRFPLGTVLSVPSYTVHNDDEVWGPDASEFRPDRWDADAVTERQRMAFNPFSYGPRACVGQNVALMELVLIVGTAFRRYDFRLYQPRLESHEGFSKKPVECWVGIRRRGGSGEDV